MAKTKAKSLVLNLLCQYGIDDEDDINGIDYIQNDSKLIETSCIAFKNLEGNHLK